MDHLGDVSEEQGVPARIVRFPIDSPTQEGISARPAVQNIIVMKVSCLKIDLLNF